MISEKEFLTYLQKTSKLNKVFKKNITTYDLYEEDQKVQVEYTFCFKNKDGKTIIAHLYLWKEYFTIHEDCNYDFHIGATGVSESNDLYNYLLEHI